MGKLRWLLVCMGAFLLALLCSGVWFWFRALSHSEAPARQLILEARAAAEQADVRRPVHVPQGLPGSFGEAVGPYLAAMAPLPDGQDERRAWQAVRDGRAPVASLPSSCLAILNGKREAVRGVLRATHTAGARPSATMALLAGPMPEGPKFQPLMRAANLALLDAHTLLQAGDAAQAAQECADLFALARDTAYGTGLIGAMIGVAIQNIAFPGCTVVLLRSPDPVQREALRQLTIIRQGMPPMSQVLRGERIWDQLMFQGRHR